MVEFGEQLRRAREAKGMTQQSLAEQLYVTRQSVSRWECGDRYPDLLTTKKISRILEVCNLRRASATDALTSGRLAEQNGRPPDNPNSVLQLDHHDIMLGDPLEDCVSRYCIVHDHGLPFVWFPLGTDDRAP